jgi:hypothetical protein
MKCMKTIFNISVSAAVKSKPYVTCLFLVFGLTTSVLALGGKLTSPGQLSFPKDYPESTRTRFLAALQRPDSKFLGGDFVNSVSNLRYGGDTKALHRFLDALATCPGATVSISFVAGFDEEADWRVSHNGHKANRFHVQINLRSKQIHLEDLVIPDIKGGAAEP